MTVRLNLVSFLFQCCLCLSIFSAAGQARQKNELIFISDCQRPLGAEKIIRKERNNIAGRELLFRDIEKRNADYLFFLGDLVGKGSNDGEWSGLDGFLKNLHDQETKIFAVPGNHEYLFNPSRGMTRYKSRFPGLPETGYCVRTDSMAVVMLNSNFRNLPATDSRSQQKWFEATMDSLEVDPSVLAVVLCTHHSPFSNSKVVGSSVKVQEAFLPRFKSSAKARLLLSGHSHNLENFEVSPGKHCLVIGGGGGIYQPLYSGTREKFRDLVPQEVKPRYFYMEMHRKGNHLEVTIHGFSAALKPVPEIELSL